MLTCKDCGGTEVEMTVFPLEPMADAKDGSGGQRTTISEDAMLHCVQCDRRVAVKVRDLRGEAERTF